jgi:O-antigen biosynthesis protein WbqP
MKYHNSKRLFDFIFSIFGLILILPIISVLYLIVKVTSNGPFLHWSKRIGKCGEIFLMPKIRTMNINTPQVATHLLLNPQQYTNSASSFLRKSSLDELPQIWSIFRGHMSFVGPRPALFNQCDLIELRKKQGIDKLIPGLTGWAQINGRDELSVEEKVLFEVHYLNNCSFFFDKKIIIMTFLSIIRFKNISY